MAVFPRIWSGGTDYDTGPLPPSSQSFVTSDGSSLFVNGVPIVGGPGGTAGATAAQAAAINANTAAVAAATATLTGGALPTKVASLTPATTSAAPTVSRLNLYDATSGNVTPPLPLANSVPAGTVIGIKKTDTTVNLVSPTCAGTDHIGTTTGGTSIPIRLADQITYLSSDGSGVWSKVAGELSLPAVDGRFAPRGRANSYNRVGYGLKKFSKSLTLCQAGTRDARIVIVGPSTAQGIGSSTNATNPEARSWPRVLAYLLNGGLMPATPGGGIPRTNSSAQLGDTRWTAGAGWTLAGDNLAGVGAGNKRAYYKGVGATGALVFADPTVLADRFDIYYVVNGGSTSTGTVSATATGGTAATADASAGTTKVIGKLTASAGSAALTNSVSISNPTAGKNLYGPLFVEPWLSTQTRVRVSNLSASGSTSSDWVTENAAGSFYGGVDLAKALTPDLTIIDMALLINDIANGISTATSVANFAALIASAQTTGDVLLKAPMPLANGSAIGVTPAQEAAAMNAVTAANPTLPFVDTFNGLGGNADAYAASGDMAADNIHGGDAIYGDEAQMLAAFFRSL